MIYRLRVRRRGVIVADVSARNFVADGGLAHLAYRISFFNGTLPLAPALPLRYAGLFDAGTISPGDTLAANGFTEFIGYNSGTNRIPIFTLGTTSAAGDIVELDAESTGTNVVTAPATIFGLFVTNQSSIANVVGDIWNGLNLSTPVAVSPGDELTISLAGSFQASL